MSTLPALLLSYTTGNKEPRGRVLPRLRWLESEEAKWARFQAARVAEAKRRAHFPFKLPQGGDCCRVAERWLYHDYRQLILAIKPGCTAADLARATSRSIGAVVARLSQMKLTYANRTSYGFFQADPQWRKVTGRLAMPVKIPGEEPFIDLRLAYQEAGWEASKVNGAYHLPDGVAAQTLERGK